MRASNYYWYFGIYPSSPFPEQFHTYTHSLKKNSYERPQFIYCSVICFIYLKIRLGDHSKSTDIVFVLMIPWQSIAGMCFNHSSSKAYIFTVRNQCYSECSCVCTNMYEHFWSRGAQTGPRRLHIESFNTPVVLPKRPQQLTLPSSSLLCPPYSNPCWVSCLF